MGRGIYIWGKYEINVHKSLNMDLKIYYTIQCISFENKSLAVMVKDLGVVGWRGVGSSLPRGYYKV